MSQELQHVIKVKAVAELLKAKTVRAARCSSAQARGAAKKYSYWGATEYEIRLSAKGDPIAIAVRAASSDRRSHKLAERDTDDLAERIGGIVITSIGRLNESDLLAAWHHLTEAE